MKRLFSILTLAIILLTACSTLNAATNEQAANIQQVEQSANSTVTDSKDPKQERPDRTKTKEPTQIRPDRTKREDKPEGIAHFELNDTFQALLDKVNAEHEAIKIYDGDYEQYLVKNEESDFNIDQRRRLGLLPHPVRDIAELVGTGQLQHPGADCALY